MCVSPLASPTSTVNPQRQDIKPQHLIIPNTAISTVSVQTSAVDEGQCPMESRAPVTGHFSTSGFLAWQQYLCKLDMACLKKGPREAERKKARLLSIFRCCSSRQESSLGPTSQGMRVSSHAQLGWLFNPQKSRSLVLDFPHTVILLTQFLSLW